MKSVTFFFLCGTERCARARLRILVLSKAVNRIEGVSPDFVSVRESQPSRAGEYFLGRTVRKVGKGKQ
jgi:hypothetical protein